VNWYLDVLKNYAEFGGRAGREEYWHFTLLNIGIAGGIAFIFADTWLWTIYTLAVLIPSIAVSVRRLHDIDHSGWWVLVALVPVLDIALLFLLMQDSRPGENQYGFNPKDVIA
jgi:uncharacterized membrane protein YhaH (DUF805 family)